MFKKTTLAVVVSSLFSIPAVANSTNSENVDEIIVVKGQKLERALQDTKESVAVVTTDAIEEYAIVDLNNAFALSANVYDLGAGESFGIRGVSQNSSSTGGGTGELGSLYVDGVAYTGFASRFMPKDLWDVEQVEVLRGPQSTNVGRNALIGAVVVTTKRPELGYHEAALRVGGGNYGKRSIEAMFNAPISDIAAFRFSGQFAESDGYITNAPLNDDKFDARKNYNLRSQLLIEPSDIWRLNLSAQYAKTDRGQDIYYVNEANGFPLDSRTSQDDVEAYERYNGWALAANLDYMINSNWSLNAVTSYLTGDYSRQDDTDRKPGITGNVVNRTVDDQNISQELRFNYHDSKLNGVIGLYATQVKYQIDSDRIDGFTLESFGITDPTFNALYGTLYANQDYKGGHTTENIALFNEWDYQLDSNWILSAGFRYDYEKLKVDQTDVKASLANGTTLPTANTGNPLIDGTITAINNQINGYLGDSLTPALDTSFHAFLPQLGATYKVSQDTSVSAFYKRGYRSGGAEFQANSRETVKYDPEYLNNYELSARSQWLGGDLVTNANAYYGDWGNQQINVCPAGDVTACRTENAAKSEIYGAELEAQYRVTRDLAVFSNIGWAKTKFKDYVSKEGDFSGNEFAFSPEFTSSIGGRYFITDSLYATATANYQSEMWGDIANNPEYKMDSRTLFDASIGYLGENYKVDAYIKNITDEFYLTGNWDSTGDRNVRAGAPREFGAYLSFFL
ncbi:TonB-dependent receptor [Vibrio sp. SCSIO 43136]|uniref:TonB-dependent receptor n=1 Tax=Vibrio sp. SCSIO 43136 TaxID=2819101 RepID=UPI0020759473|nr:TonB-dependent receptor [Vibrio sp. SCSIO 43136]USD67277.1 TonB-dependent receptor [Vibrio sp. SCSIO 43136]